MSKTFDSHGAAVAHAERESKGGKTVAISTVRKGGRVKFRVVSR